MRTRTDVRTRSANECRVVNSIINGARNCMPNRHDRRKALSTYGETKFKSSTLDQHFEETLCRVRADFEGRRKVQSAFHCVTDTESFDISAHWPDRTAKAATCAALRDTFRHRGV